MLSIFPNGLDSFDKDVDSGSFGHLTWALEVLVHAPELVDCAEVGESLDVFLVPTVALVLGEQRVLVVEGSM